MANSFPNESADRYIASPTKYLLDIKVVAKAP